jgi:transcriptional regulator with XRE-family HTH domain
MTTEFALDLKVARRKSGLSQQDCAHLLEVHPSKISLMEHGKAMPSVRDICTLSLVYGKSFESLFAAIMADAYASLSERLASMPECPKQWLPKFNRQNTLNSLAFRLSASSHLYGGA